MMIPNMASSMIAIRYHFHGPAMPMVTACASGTNAIGEALRLIRHGYADAMVAGGAGGDRQRAGRRGLLQYAGPLPLRRPERGFPALRRPPCGFVMGEGAGVLVLEELEHAEAARRNDLCRTDWLRLHL